MEVELHRLARADFDRASRYLGRHAPYARIPFIHAVNAELERIAKFPDAGSPEYVRYRFVKTRKFHYVIHYRRWKNDYIMVYAVAHPSRRPGYWLRRTRKS